MEYAEYGDGQIWPSGSRSIWCFWSVQRSRRWTGLEVVDGNDLLWCGSFCHDQSPRGDTRATSRFDWCPKVHQGDMEGLDAPRHCCTTKGARQLPGASQQRRREAGTTANSRHGLSANLIDEIDSGVILFGSGGWNRMGGLISCCVVPATDERLHMDKSGRSLINV